MPARIWIALLITCACHGLHARGPSPLEQLRHAEALLADGDGAAARALLEGLLRTPALSRTDRVEAGLILAETWFQEWRLEKMLALSDSTAMLLDPDAASDAEAWARIEINRSRHAHGGSVHARAIQQARSALHRYQRAADRGNWRWAFLIHRQLATTYRVNPEGYEPNRIFLHFDTALALLQQRGDLLPYWGADLWRGLSNAALDRNQPNDPLENRQKYRPICDAAQLRAIQLIDTHHPSNRIFRSELYNLRGLFLSYTGSADSARSWHARSRELIRQDVWQAKRIGHISVWLASLNYESMALPASHAWLDTVELRSHLERLQGAEELFAIWSEAEASSSGLFTREPYTRSTLSATAATCHRLWELTGDPSHAQILLRANETVRRQAWNIAQRAHGRQHLVLGPAPHAMFDSVQSRLADDEGLVVLIQPWRPGFLDETVIGLAVTNRDWTFWSAPYQHHWAETLERSAHAVAVTRSLLHSAYQQLYLPAAHVLRDPVTRLRILGNSFVNVLPYDALIADTLSLDFSACHPLVERYSISYPYFLLPPIAPRMMGASVHYQAPAPSPVGDLTDLMNLRAAMARWSQSTFPGTLDSSNTDGETLLQNISRQDLLVLGGHCGGHPYTSEVPSFHWSTCSKPDVCSFHPDAILRLLQPPDLVVHAACQSGSYSAFGSSGSASFARAFLFAGSTGTIASMAPADEHTTVRLLDLFMQELQLLPADRALQEAKLRYLQQVATTSESLPANWAVWQLFGEAPATIKGVKKRWYWLIAGAFCLVGIFLWRRLRK